MLSHRYKVWSWGSRISKDDDDWIKYRVGLTAIAKRHIETPYEAYNELVAMSLGRMLGLPIPIGFVMEHDGSVYYCSGHFSASGGEAPDADVEHLAANQRKIACGIVLFDAWICNTDRHAKNLFYDSDEGRVFLFDHGAALLSYSGQENLQQNEDTIVIHPDFANEVFDFGDFNDWYDKLLRIPDFAITSASINAQSVGVTEIEAHAVSRFLIRRRSKLWSIFKENVQGTFPKYQPSLFPVFGHHNDPIDYSI